MGDGSGASASADQALAVPVEPVARLDPAGFDPSRDGFPNARLARVASRIERMASKELGELVYGMSNPLFCAADASQIALDFFAELRNEIEHYERQAAIAMEARQGPDRATGLDGEAATARAGTASPK